MILIVIPAKGTSSRLPGKNMRKINGRPMIDYAVDEARRCTRPHHIIVSTDTSHIAEHVARSNVEVLMRGKRLGGDTPLYDVYKHSADHYGLDKFSLLVGLQVDHPDRNISVDRAIKFFETEHADYLSRVDGEGNINGSYKIYTRDMMIKFNPVTHVKMEDNCTNIHYVEDLEKAEEVLRELNI